ncbi:cyclase family protein [Paenibacillus gorillae]|uniref:cyclase family protein n=1 Tax=Paenibacillus gorillae TaxID=1243662 RepID=UPI0004B50130|nr:cyclase family protein [Paenibacillus gorillae]
MLIDLSHPIRNGMPIYPGDTETKLEHAKQFKKDGYNNHLLTINMHAGTHIDGPMHLLDIDKRINEFPVDRFIGRGCLLDVRGQSVIDARPEYEAMIEPNDIVIVLTGHGKQYGSPGYFDHYPVLTESFAKLMVRKQVKMVGLDTPSPDQYPFEVHQILFREQIFLIENLANAEQLLDAGPFEVIALPLHIDADSSVARVIARSL